VDHEEVSAVRIDDRLRGHRVNVSCSPASGLWSWPLDTASHSEGGIERVFQGLALVTHWPLTAAGKQSASFTVEIAFEALAGA
jgi:hypothetical protein